ncbi:unnamed protein product [Dicrocoelium dendriticum]|nr:unnamed protein product [Dicrocoelium dendriticum]
MSDSLNTNANVSSAALISESNAVCGSGSCSKPVTDESGGMQCYVCNCWYHETCTDLSPDQYAMLSTSDSMLFNCLLCRRRRSTRLEVTEETSSNVGLGNQQLWSFLISLDRKVELLMRNMGVSIDVGSLKEDTQLTSIAVDGNPTEVMSTVSCVPAVQNASKGASDVVLEAVQSVTELIAPGPNKSKRKRAKKVRKAASKPEGTESIKVLEVEHKTPTPITPVPLAKQRAVSTSATPAKSEKTRPVRELEAEDKASTSITPAHLAKKRAVSSAKPVETEVASKTRGVNTPRRGDSFTDSSVIFRNVAESAAALPKERMLDDLQWFKLCVNKMLPPGFPGVTIRKLTRLGNVPVDTPNPRPRLLRVVLSTPEERKALMRFAFKLKGSNVSVQPDLPLADRLKLKEAIKSLKSRRAAGEQGLRLVGFQVVSRKSNSALPEPLLVAYDPGLVVPSSFG